MTYLTIKNIGPITNADTIAIIPLTLITGEQSTGKSIFLKILSHCSWFEKKLMIGDDWILRDYTHNQKFLKHLKRFYHLSDDLFSSDSVIRYETECLILELNGTRKNVKVVRKHELKHQVHNFIECFIPSHRNLLFTLPKLTDSHESDFSCSVDYIIQFMMDWWISVGRFTPEKPLDVVVAEGTKYFYDEKTGKSFLGLPNGNIISPLYPSSGVQSALPIIGMARILHSQIGEKGCSINYIPPEDRNILIQRYFKLFIEEPEQNLHPEAQYALMAFLVRQLNSAPRSSLIFTSHSPYILTFINILIKAALAKSVDSDKTGRIITKDWYLTIDSISAYNISYNGEVRSIIDPETSLIRGEYLDSISDIFDEKIYELNKIIYGED